MLPLPPHGLCMSVAFMGSRCCVCVCVCVCVCECVQVCARLGESDVHCCAPLGRARAGCRPLAVALCVRTRWDAAPKPGLCPGQALTKQQAGAGFVFNCDIWGVFARSPAPHPLSLTFCYNNSLIFPSSPPFTFLPFSFNQKLLPPKANPRCI